MTDQDLRELRELLGDQKFIEPKDDFIDWLIEYAKDRMIIDVGCGNGHVTRAINAKGGKAIGVDPFMTDACKMSAPSAFYQHKIEHTPFRNLPGHQVLYLLARPCHGHFTELTLAYAQPQSEVLYVGLHKNVEIDFFKTFDFHKVDAPTAKSYELALSVKKS